MTNHIIVFISTLISIPLVFDVNASPGDTYLIIPGQTDSSTETREESSVEEVIGRSSVRIESKKTRKNYTPCQQATFYPFKSAQLTLLSSSRYISAYRLMHIVISTTVLLM